MLFSAAARPETPPAIDRTPAEIDARVRFLTTLLDSEARTARVWNWSWVATYGAVTITQVSLIPFLPERDTRTDLWVGSVSSFIGALGLAASPLILPSAERLPSDPSAALAELERRLKAGAEKERFGTSWFVHVANAGVNLAIGLVLGLGYRHWQTAAISFGAGLLAGEVTLLTRPTRLIQTEQVWSSGVLPGDSPVRVVPSVSPGGAGIALVW